MKLSWLSFSLLAGAALAQDLPSHVPAAASRTRLPWPADRVLTDVAADGALWAAAETWKAEFGARGAVFFPFRGGDAPAASACFALRAARAGAVPIAIGDATPTPLGEHGQCVAYERGGARELFDLRQDGVEQRFEFATLPNRGELQLEVAVTTTLAHGTDAAGHAFADEHGGVHYGAAVAIDAAGRRAALETTWTGQALRITVPARFVATAELPLVVDPLIGSITNVTGPNGVALSATDVAYDASLDQYFVAYERAYSAGDHDVYVVACDSAMQPAALVTIDFTSNYWARPRIAVLEAHDRVGVVAQVSPSNSPPFAVQMRLFTGGPSPSPDPMFVVSSNPQYSRVTPDIGGDANPIGPTKFLVVFELFDSSANVSTAEMTLVDATGTTSNTQGLSSGINFGRRPAVSKTCGTIGGNTESWCVVVRAEYLGQTDGELRAWFVTRSGSVRNAAGPYVFAQLTATTPNLGSEWDVSSPTDNANGRVFLCVERRIDAATGRGNVRGHAFGYDGSMLVADQQLLAPSVDRRSPVADSDGCRFAVACADEFSATDADVLCETVVLLGSQLVVQDLDIVSYDLDRDDQPALCSRQGTRNAYGLAWVHQANGAWTMQGQVYRGTGAGGVTVRATSCGGIGIGWSGGTALGETITATLSFATGIGGFLVGSPVSLPIGPCPGCIQGADGITLLGAQVSITVPANPVFVGYALSIQGARYDPSLGPCLGILAFSDTIDLVVQ